METFGGNPGSACGGGSYINMTTQVNPFTGSRNCPVGYNQQLAFSMAYCKAAMGTNVFDTYYCWK